MSLQGRVDGDDILIGTNFADELFGQKGKDILSGEDGNDYLSGGKGRDILFGGDGDDILAGGKGNDTLIGGDDIDTFVFAGKSGKDTVLDYDVDTDALHIQADNKITSVEDVIARASENKKGDVVISLGSGDKIVLKGVTLDDFKADPHGHIEVL